MNMRITPNVDPLKSSCWEYDINAMNIYNILKTKKDDSFPISYESLRLKVLKHVPIESLKEIFTNFEMKVIFSDINTKRIRNPKTKQYLNTLQ